MLSRPLTFLILLGCITQTATAASDAELRKCQAITDAQARLTCYDQALQPAEPPATISPRTQAAEPEAMAARQAPAIEPEMTTTPGAPAPVQPQPPVPAPVAVPAPAPTTAPIPAVQTAEDFGLPEETDWEQIKDNQMIATVSGVRKTPLGSIIVELDNGHVWQQVDNKRLTLRKGDEVNIREGMGGAFYLAKTSGSRSLKVRRTK